VDAKNVTLLLGAGASASTGIPTAYSLIDEVVDNLVARSWAASEIKRLKMTDREDLRDECDFIRFETLLYWVEDNYRNVDYGQVSRTSGTAVNVPDVHVFISESNDNNLYGDLGGTHQVAHQDIPQDRIKELLNFCSIPRTRNEMQQFMSLSDRGHFRASILKPLLASGKLTMTIPDKANSRYQKYIRTSRYLENAEK
jgi:hypothetical protein